MGAKDPENATNAQAGAAQGSPASPVPAADSNPCLPCQKKHWFAVRVQFDDGKPITTGIKMKVKLNTGETRDVVLDAASGGKFDTGKILDPASVCEVSFPDTYDAECTPK